MVGVSVMCKGEVLPECPLGTSACAGVTEALFLLRFRLRLCVDLIVTVKLLEVNEPVSSALVVLVVL